MKTSIVIPCYKSEESVYELVERIINVGEKENYDLQIILVNDCSPDETLTELKRLVNTYEQVEVIDLMFNVGQFKALMCGLESANGDFVVTMDDDLQHPPEEIPKMLNYLQAQEELDIIFGKPEKKEHKTYRNLGSLFIRFIN